MYAIICLFYNFRVIILHGENLTVIQEFSIGPIREFYNCNKNNTCSFDSSTKLLVVQSSEYNTITKLL